MNRFEGNFRGLFKRLRTYPTFQRRTYDPTETTGTTFDYFNEETSGNMQLRIELVGDSHQPVVRTDGSNGYVIRPRKRFHRDPNSSINITAIGVDVFVSSRVKVENVSKNNNANVIISGTGRR